MRRRPLIAATILVLAGAGSIAVASDRSRRLESQAQIATPPVARAGQSIPAFDGLRACPGDGRLDFAHYYLGSSFEGLPLKAVLRNCERPVKGEPFPGRQNVITFVVAAKAAMPSRPPGR